MAIRRFYKLVFVFSLMISSSAEADDNHRELQEKIYRAGIGYHENSNLYNLKSRRLLGAEIIEGELVTFMREVDDWCYFDLVAIDLSIGLDGSISNHSGDFKVSRKRIKGCSYPKLSEAQEVVSVGFESMEQFSLFNSYLQREISKSNFAIEVSKLIGEKIDSRGIVNAFIKLQHLNGIVISKHYLVNEILELTWKMDENTFQLICAELNMDNPI